MRIKVTLSRPLREVLPGRDGLRRALPRIAADLSRSVRDRTAGGRDVRGRRFARKADGSPSTLRDTGKMIKSFGTASMRPTGFTLGPSGAERRKAVMHQTGRGVPRREWVGVDARQVDQAAERVASAEFGERKS